MKTLLIIVTLIFVASAAFADRLDIPFSCYPKQLQEKFAKHGKKLDLSANDRDEKSWGFIESHGSDFSIFTYQPLDIPKELEEIQKIISER